jgi:hypothetical protein
MRKCANGSGVLKMTEDQNMLSEKERTHIKRYMACIAFLGRHTVEPLDPKVEPLLQIIHALLGEQLKLDKKYEWGPRVTMDDMFLDETDIPSAEDLRKMMGDENDT